MTNIQTGNKIFFKIFEEIGFKSGNVRNKIQISKCIPSVDTVEKNGFIFEKGQLFQHAVQNFLFSIVKFTGSQHFSGTMEEKVFEASKNSDFEIHLFKTPTGQSSVLALAIIQDNKLFHFESFGNRKNHNELIDFIKKTAIPEMIS